MGNLLDDMLLLARLDQDRPLERGPVDLLGIATEAVIDAEALQPRRSVALHHVPGERAPVVIGDEARLRQVLANLLANALAHTPPTSPVQVTVAQSVAYVELAGCDAGPGMPPGVVAKVFDRFYRSDPGRTRQHGGPRPRPLGRQVAGRGPRRHRHV